MDRRILSVKADAAADDSADSACKWPPRLQFPPLRPRAPRPMKPFVLPLTLSLCLAAGVSAAQDTVVQAENVTYAYAQVLRVTPVYQTLTATRMEQRCGEDASALSRVVGKVKKALGRDGTRPDANGCRMVPVTQQFRRPIAFDVDYTYRGSKFRSRLAEDPGNRLRIRISVVPMVGGPTSR